MDFRGLFDAYGRQARLWPALRVLFPLFFTIPVSFPLQYGMGTALLVLAGAGAVTVLLAHRTRAERALISEPGELWSGEPPSIYCRLLRRSDANIDADTKRRYYAFLERHIQAWRAPTAEQERADPAAADALYETAIKWLIEHTRDRKRFPLVFKAKVSYGLRYNLYVLQPLGLTVVALSYVLFVVAAIKRNSFLATTFGPPDAEELMLIASFLVILSALYSWPSLGPAEEAVRNASDAYAKALLAVCEDTGLHD